MRHTLPQPQVDADDAAVLDGWLGELRNIETAIRIRARARRTMFTPGVCRAWDLLAQRMEEDRADMSCPMKDCPNAGVIDAGPFGRLCGDCAPKVKLCRGCQAHTLGIDLDAIGFCDWCNQPDTDTIASQLHAVLHAGAGR